MEHFFQHFKNYFVRGLRGGKDEDFDFIIILIILVVVTNTIYNSYLRISNNITNIMFF